MVEKNVEVRKRLIGEYHIPFAEYELKVGQRYNLNRGVKLMNLEIGELIDGYNNIIVDISYINTTSYLNS